MIYCNQVILICCVRGHVALAICLWCSQFAIPCAFRWWNGRHLNNIHSLCARNHMQSMKYTQLVKNIAWSGSLSRYLFIDHAIYSPTEQIKSNSWLNHLNLLAISGHSPDPMYPYCFISQRGDVNDIFWCTADKYPFHFFPRTYMFCGVMWRRGGGGGEELLYFTHISSQVVLGHSDQIRLFYLPTALR